MTRICMPGARIKLQIAIKAQPGRAGIIVSVLKAARETSGIFRTDIWWKKYRVQVFFSTLVNSNESVYKPLLNDDDAVSIYIPY